MLIAAVDFLGVGRSLVADYSLDIDRSACDTASAW